MGGLTDVCMLFLSFFGTPPPPPPFLSLSFSNFLSRLSLFYSLIEFFFSFLFSDSGESARLHTLVDELRERSESNSSKVRSLACLK